MRIILDSNIFDQLLIETVFLDLLENAAIEGQITLVVTHIQENELLQTGDAAKRAALLSVFNRLAKLSNKVPTQGCIPGFIQPGFSCPSDGGPHVKLNDIRDDKKPKHAADALLAATADAEADVLVTQENRLPNRIGDTNSMLKVWNFTQLKAYITSI
jgi:predicted nucleic acid-binding protein